MSNTIEDKLAKIEARIAFEELIANYCHGFDKRDYDRFLSIWWEDCTWDIGPPFGSFEGHAGIYEAIYDVLWPAWQQSRHYTTNLVVNFSSPTTATGLCDVDCIGTTADNLSQTVAATYADDFERRDGIWKIKKRKVTIHHFNPIPGLVLSAPQG